MDRFVFHSSNSRRALSYRIVLISSHLHHLDFEFPGSESPSRIVNYSNYSTYKSNVNRQSPCDEADGIGQPVENSNWKIQPWGFQSWSGQSLWSSIVRLEHLYRSSASPADSCRQKVGTFFGQKSFWSRRPCASRPRPYREISRLDVSREKHVSKKGGRIFVDLLSHGYTPEQFKARTFPKTDRAALPLARRPKQTLLSVCVCFAGRRVKKFSSCCNDAGKFQFRFGVLF